MAKERSLIEMARGALARGRPADALKALVTHAKKHPRGQLVEEREGLSVLCLISLGKRELGRTLAETFRSRYPNSLLLPAIESALKPE
ncbi:MAG: hypothetical protein V1754_14905 [Pseudomonadota bacterium]